jgi:beta-glucosidase
LDIGFPGQEGGRATADVLVGKINPSGKSPDTWGQRREDYPDYGNFPGGKDGKVNYAEGIYVGYRHFDKKNIKPFFPFGYGLSYTNFKYSGLKLSADSIDANGKITAIFNITNTGEVAGSEVAELYVSDLQPKVDRPIRELKGFSKVALQPGETQKVSLTITPQDLSYYDTDGHRWLAQPGAYAVEIGASSRDIKMSKTVTLESVYSGKP